MDYLDLVTVRKCNSFPVGPANYIAVEFDGDTL